MSTIRRDDKGLFVRVGTKVLRPVSDSNFYENDIVTAKANTVGKAGVPVSKDNVTEFWRISAVFAETL
jgi:hypothetical protein